MPMWRGLSALRPAVAGLGAGTLAALLATKLKLVNVAGKALKAGDDVATALAGAAVKYLCRSFCLSSPLSRSDRSCSG